MSEKLIIRRDGNIWICSGEGRTLEAVGFVDLVIRIRKDLGMNKFTVSFDSEGSGIDGAIATFDFGAPDTYIGG